MPARTEYAHGTPSWIDLATPDVEKAKEFYNDLFGWAYDEQPAGEQGTYVMADLDGAAVAGMMEQDPSQGMPPFWNTYVTVDDLEAAVGRVEPAGGTVMMPPMDVMDAGRMAVIVDPTGGIISLWETKGHIGARVVNEPGSLCWNELVTTDVAAAAKFYGDVLGWTTEEMEMGPDMPPYIIFKVGDDGVAGAMNPPMPGMPTFWSVYIAVEDADKTVEKARAAGATIHAEPTDTGVGRLAAIADPTGAVVSVIALADQS
jgi:predicted enzyme related to lactoylglutathione lyase